MRDVGVGQLVEELEQRGDRLPFEIGAFVALEACEGLLQESVRIEPDDVRVTLEGGVVVAESASAAEPDEAARSLISVLARLLVAAGPGVPPYLLQLVQENTTDASERDLKELHDAIEASLIPVNRSASRRVLARLVRESERPPAPSAPLVPDVDPQELDAELDELLRDPALRTLEPRRSTPPEPPAQATSEEIPEDDPVTERIRIPRGVREDERAGAGAEAAAAAATMPEPSPLAANPEPVTATIRKWVREDEPALEDEPETEVMAKPEPEPALDPEPDPERDAIAGAEPAEPPEAEPDEPEAPEPVEAETPTEAVFSHGSASVAESIPAAEPQVRDSRASLDPPAVERVSQPQQQPTRRGGWGAWLLVAALGLGVYALFATGAFQNLVAPAAPPPAPSGVVALEVAPEDAQIFLYVGRGPSVADGLAVGAPHEFVVFHEGLRPTRVAVPADGAWSTADGAPLYELAVQPQPASTSTDAADFGVPLTEVGAASGGRLGAVRVVTNPPGAKVYRYLGLGPNVSLTVGSIHEGQEVLIVRPGYETRRAVIGPSDWETVEGEPRASLRIELPEVPALAVPQSPED